METRRAPFVLANPNRKYELLEQQRNLERLRVSMLITHNECLQTIARCDEIRTELASQRQRLAAQDAESKNKSNIEELRMLLGENDYL